MAQKKKISIIGEEARAKVRAGVDKVVDAVKLTHGPAGRNFASGVRGGPVRISNDGVSLAKEIQGDDEFEDIGVRAVKEATTKTNDKAGDGTTTSAVLVKAILVSIEFYDPGIGWNPVERAKIIKEEGKKVVERLTEIAKPIESREHLVQIAKVAVEDDALAELIGGAQWDVGKDGTVIAEEHNATEDEIEHIHGVRIDNGFGTSRMANNIEKQALDIKNTRIIVTNKIFNSAKSLKQFDGIFEKLVNDGVDGLVIVARAFDDTAIGWLMNNLQLFVQRKSALAVYPINAPYEDQDEVMEDLAAATGSKFIKDGERNIESMLLTDVGMASEIFCTRHEGIVTGPEQGFDERVDALVAARIEDIDKKLTGDISHFQKRQLEKRRAQLTTGTAKIKVGAETEQERMYKKDKVDDAINAVKAAIVSGVVPGAGIALKMIGEEMKDSMIASALSAPYNQIMENAGGPFEVPEWVEDPLKVVQTAFEKATSIAASLATTEILVTWQWEKEVPWAPQQPQNEE